MKKIIIAAVILTGAITGLARLPLAWIGNAALPATIQPRPVFLGTIWKGQIANIEGINPINLTINPGKILNGQPPAIFESQSPYLRFSGHARLNGSISVLANGDIKGLGVFEPRLKPLSGTYDFTLSDASVSDVCKSGSGQIQTDILAANFAVWNWRGPELSGPITCENGKFLARLDGSDGRQTFAGMLQFGITGSYQMTIDVITADPQAEFVLPLFGFEKTTSGYRISEAGRWR